MKSLIIYFSQTGNTLSIAKCIYIGIMEASGTCNIKSLNEIDVNDVSDYDLVGIGSPVFYYKEPINVRNFIESLPELNGQHWFVFCTHGNIVGNFFPSVTEKLKKKGAALIGFHNSYANITVPFYPGICYTSGHPDSYDFEQAKTFGRNIARLSSEIKNKDGVFIDASYPLSSDEWIQESNTLTEEILKTFLPKLTMNSDTCTQCHKCEENCPVNGINIEEDPPRLQDPCIYCWRCVNTCPTLSIGADWEPFVRMVPTNFARYKKELDKAAARGEFRWLVDPENIASGEPLYKQREREVKSKVKKKNIREIY